VEFALKGFTAVGVDLTEEYLAEARRRAGDNGVDIELVRGDMREFSRPDTFDLAVNLFTSLGFFEEPGDDIRVLENLHRSLKPGGRLIIELTGKEILARIFRERDWHRDGETIFLEERRVADSWSRMINTWTILENGKRSEYRFTLRLYSARELMNTVEACGFREVEAFGSLSGAPYDETAERLVVTAHK
jgi:SAM-dependent methyltransferase